MTAGQFFLDNSPPPLLHAWLSGNALVSSNVVTLRRTRLVPGWVTVLGRVNKSPGYRTGHIDRLILSHLSVGRQK